MEQICFAAVPGEPANHQTTSRTVGHGICRDVKPSNFLFLSEHADAPLKAIDFGMATYCNPGQKLDDKAGDPCSRILVSFPNAPHKPV